VIALRMRRQIVSEMRPGLLSFLVAISAIVLLALR
jgi:hypothetical protein